MRTNPTRISAPAGTPFIDVLREFDAAPELVIRASIDPDLIERWAPAACTGTAMISAAAVSLDGFIADSSDAVGPLSIDTATGTSRSRLRTPTGSFARLG